VFIEFEALENAIRSDQSEGDLLGTNPSSSCCLHEHFDAIDSGDRAGHWSIYLNKCWRSKSHFKLYIVPCLKGLQTVGFSNEPTLSGLGQLFLENAPVPHSGMTDKKYFPGQESFYYGQRLSFEGALCTVRYFGPLAGTKGQWLGIEWDDPSRGKHSGQHQGKTVFRCLSPSPTAASFIRPSRPTDPKRAFLDAVRFKYGDGSHGTTSNGVTSGSQRPQIWTEPLIEISGKAVEEVGFDRIRQQQGALENLKIVAIDGLCVAGISNTGCSKVEAANEQYEIAKCCPNIVELDLGWNLLETLQEVIDICSPLRKLRSLRLRFVLVPNTTPLILI
jgi:CAP-Gly domain